MSIRLLVVDRFPVVVEGLQTIFAREPDIDLVAVESDGNAAWSVLVEQEPDVALLGGHLPGMDSLELLRKAREMDLSSRIVLYFSEMSDEVAVEALQLGVNGMLLLEMPMRLVVQCVRKVSEGGRWLEIQSLARVVDRMQAKELVRQDAVERLSSRELDVTRLVLLGMSNKEIAGKLGLSVGTIKIHMHNIFEKLGISSRLQLANYARENGFMQR